MPMTALAPIIGGGISAVSGLFGRQQTQDTRPVYTTDQQSVQHNIGDLLKTRLEHPTEYVGTMKNAAMGGVNSNYASIAERMKRNMAARGFGSSGKANLNLQGLELARAGELSDLESRFAGLQMQQDQNLLDAGTRFGFAGGGSHSTGNAGGGIGGAIGAGAETATLLYALNHFMGGGGDGGIDIPMDRTIGR